jgi:hypothetical protein
MVDYIKILKPYFKNNTLTVPNNLFIQIALTKMGQALENKEITEEQLLEKFNE